MSRLADLVPEQMSEAQRRIYDQVVPAATPLKKTTFGLFNPWLRNPGMAECFVKTAQVLRHETALPSRLTELAILAVARRWRCEFAWNRHLSLALAGGLDSEIVSTIAANRRPIFAAADEEAVYDFCLELLDNRAASDATFARTLEQIGEQQVVELTAIIGYYVMVCMTLTAFEVARPKDVAPPFTD